MTRGTESRAGHPSRDSASVDASAGGPPAGSRVDFTVVGIGACAGGLEALTQFFEAMPAGSGLAFIVIQHLDPARERLTPELLGRHTAMEVGLAEDGAPLVANRVHVIPPNRSLGISAGRLVLGTPVLERGVRIPIDAFFRSLAESQGEGAIGILLSGTGSDGTAGLKMIQAHGGLALAQDPDTAAHPGMPRSAIDAGAVDYVLPIREMPEALVSYARDAPRVREALASRARAVALGRVLALLRRHSGLDFRRYKEGTLLRRMGRRIALHGLKGLDAYARFLQRRPEEIQRLSQELLIGVTAFFREPEAFQALGEEAVVPLLRSMAAGRPVRVWVPGCATGEEAYSVAMVIAERMAELGQARELQVFGTDVDASALAVARAGVYTAARVAHLPEPRLRRFFSLEDGHYRVDKSLRGCVTFARQDLISDPPFSRLDLVSCRNLMIYLRPELQRRVLAVFQFALAQGGYLFLGGSETIGPCSGLFETVDRQWRIYRRAAGRARLPGGAAAGSDGRTPGGGWETPAPAGAAEGGADGELERELEGTLEEMESSNEELQAANEELDSSKEELQSLNDALTTVNAQLESKVEELEAVNNDLGNLLASSDVATLFLDENLRINRFTPPAQRLFSLLSSDTGRPLGDISHRFHELSLQADARAVLERREPVEREVGTVDQRWYIQRVLPYRTREDRVDGVVVTFIDITERRRMEETTRRALAATERAEREKTRFLAGTSHDLRQPLQTLTLLNAELLQRMADRSLQEVVRQQEQTLAQVQDLLDALVETAMLDTGEIVPEITEFPVQELLQRLESQFAPQARRKALALRVRPCPERVRTDRRLLARILSNFLANAVSHGASGRILLGRRRRAGALRLEVWDTGGGAPEDVVQALRGESAPAPPGPGLWGHGGGIGLAIVKRLADLLELPVDARSAPGRGSVFAVTVPRAAGTAPRAAQAVPVPAELAPRHPGPVLLVEDEESVGRALSMFLVTSGIQTHWVDNPEEALARVRDPEFRPALVVTDYWLPGRYDGLTVVREVRRLLGRDVPAVLLTGDAGALPAAGDQCQRCRLLHKPVTGARLLEVIDALLGSQA